MIDDHPARPARGRLGLASGVLSVALALSLTTPTFAAEPTLIVDVDASEVESLAPWAEKAKDLMIEWHQRIENLLPPSRGQFPKRIKLIIKKTDEGVAYTAGGRTVVVSSHWIEKHPEDIGLIVHELVHVVQNYRRGGPGWVTEGIADYIRWGLYENKPPSYFPKPRIRQGYTRAYQVAGGFLLWLESNDGPGIVNKLNRAMRAGTYSDEIFEKETGRSLDDLWAAYVGLEPAKPDAEP